MEISYPLLPLPSSTSVTPCAKPTLIHPRVYMNTSYTQDHLGSWKENGPQQNGNVLPILPLPILCLSHACRVCMHACYACMFCMQITFEIVLRNLLSAIFTLLVHMCKWG